MKKIANLTLFQAGFFELFKGSRGYLAHDIKIFIKSVMFTLLVQLFIELYFLFYDYLLSKNDDVSIFYYIINVNT